MDQWMVKWINGWLNGSMDGSAYAGHYVYLLQVPSAKLKTRLITDSRKYEQITPILKQLHWLPIDERIKYKILLLTFKALSDLAPIYIGDMLCKYAPSRRLRSSSNKLLQVPSSKLKTHCERTSLDAAPKLWNSLPNLIRQCSSLESFKTEIKTFLFEQRFD